MHRTHVLLSLLALTGLLAGLLPGALGAQEVTESAQIPGDTVVVRFTYGTRDRLNAVAGKLDIWEVHLDQGYAVAAVTPAEYGWLQSLGYPLEIDREKTALLGTEAALDPRYYYYDNYVYNSYGRYMVGFLQDTNTAYSDLVELLDIGNAWQAEHGGYHRDIWVLRITNEDPSFGDIADKPTFVLHANMHAREVTTPEMAIRYIKYLTSGYNGQGGYGMDPDVTWLVDWNVAYILVTVNPDGHVVNEQNTSANRRKNMNNTECGGGNFGIDLNRNHHFRWACCGGSSGDPCSDLYRGVTRSSEPETFYFQNFITVNNILRDQNGPNGPDELPAAAPLTTTGVLLSLHTYSDYVLWPWGFTQSPAPNSSQLIKIGRKLAYYTGYDDLGFLYTVDGDTHDWSYGQLGVASFVFEIGPSGGSCGGFFPAYGCQDGIDGMPRNFWAENRPAFLYTHKIARTPYMTAYGPDADGLVVSPDPVPGGVPLNLSAHLQDHRCCGDTPRNIAGAEYFIDQPGADGSGTPLDPQDGAWGGASETGVALVDTSGLSFGRHYALVHALSSDGYWGPFSAVFLNVTVCENVAIVDVSAQATGCVATFSAELQGSPPFAYAWDFGPFGTSQEANPTVDFGLSGTYTYALTVTNCITGSDTFAGEVSVYCCTEPYNAAFAYSPPDPLIGQSVAFTGTAEGTAPISFTWDFGDGATGVGASVSHAYGAGGDYTVQMTASNACGAQSVEHVVSVCRPAANPSFWWLPITPTVNTWVAFHGSAQGTGPIAYAWDFGDGGTGSGANVSHRYTSPGLYTVRMTASNCGGAAASVEHTVMVIPPDCDTPVDITDVETTVEGCQVAFDSHATGDEPITYLWNFGDGGSSTEADPAHLYGQSGVYSVTLDAWNCGLFHDRYALNVQVECAAPPQWSVYLPLVYRGY